MASYGISNMTTAPTLAIPEDLKNDPVTKAVYDNIMGNLPTKKPKVSVFCKVCKLEFSSQVVLDTHVAGSKHQRKLKSKELMKNLEETETGIEKNTISGVIRCTLCDVTVNSPQLLATHVAGNKHQSKKGKRENGEEAGTPAKKLCSGDATESNGVATTTESGDAVKVKKPMPPKKERPPISIDIPSCVTKLEENKTGGKFLCNPCQAHCNSDIQLSQHLLSKKHVDKLSGKKIPPPVSRGGGRGWKSLFGRGRGSTGRGGGGGINTLSSSNSWDAFSSSGVAASLQLSNSNSAYAPQSYGSQSYSSSQSYADPSAYTDSYGLSSLSRTSVVADYGYDRTSSAVGTATGRTATNGRGASVVYGRSDPYTARTDSYGRVASPYARTDVYDRADYGTEYSVARTDDIGSYSRANASEYATADYSHGYAAAAAAAAVGHAATAASRSMPFTYTAPLSHNFVAGGSIL